MKSTLHAWAWIGAAVMGMVGTEGWAQTAQDVMVIKQSNGHLLELPVENVAELYFRTNWTDVVPDNPAVETPTTLKAVDLGLPSGTKWANMNLGATKREELGDRYAWGETTTKEDFTEANYQHCTWIDAWKEPDKVDEDGFTIPGTSVSHPAGYVYDGINKLNNAPEYDAAHAQWGGDWYMPTKFEFKELIDNCTWSEMKSGDVAGYKVTGPNGKFIFLVDNVYWTATGNGSTEAYCYFNKVVYYNREYRYYGYYIRPVQSPKAIDSTPCAVEMVDLGLSVKWANMNVGASYPEDYGDYYAWGETETKEDYSWETYLKQWGGTMTDYSDCGTDKDPLKEYVDPNNKSIAGTQYDVAHVKWGGTWRMPTEAELDELVNKCTWTKHYGRDGLDGYTVTGPNGNSIFLPAAGCRYETSTYSAGYEVWYWSATPNSDYADYAVEIDFSNGSIKSGNFPRFYGFSIRPVSD